MGKNQFSRARKPKEVGTKIIIVCEGSTEEIYFEAIRKSKRLSTLKIQVVNPENSDPENIVRKAIEIRNYLIRDKRWVKEDQIWAVYDGDEHIENNLRNWTEAIRLAAVHQIKLGISNPSFELWYLLHYQDQFADIHRHETTAKLKNHIPKYHKTTDLYLTHFEPRTSAAAKRAESNSDVNERNEKEKYTNPSTEIYLLVKAISEL